MKDLDATRQIVARLENEIFRAHSVYGGFETLFVSSNETRDLLTASDSALFQDLYVVYLNYISVAVAHLLDPESTGKNENLTLYYVVEQIKERGINDHAALLEEASTIKQKAHNVTVPRNQLVAHLDLTTSGVVSFGSLGRDGAVGGSADDADLARSFPTHTRQVERRADRVVRRRLQTMMTANHALRRIRRGRPGCDRTPSWSGSLSLGR